MSKRKHHTLVSKPLAGRTFDLVNALIADGSIDAKRQYRNTKASNHKKYVKPITMAKIDGFWNPEGKRQAKGSSGKCELINRVARARS